MGETLESGGHSRRDKRGAGAAERVIQGIIAETWEARWVGWNIWEKVRGRRRPRWDNEGLWAFNKLAASPAGVAWKELVPGVCELLRRWRIVMGVLEGRWWVDWVGGVEGRRLSVFYWMGETYAWVHFKMLHAIFCMTIFWGKMGSWGQIGHHVSSPSENEKRIHFIICVALVWEKQFNERILKFSYGK